MYIISFFAQTSLLFNGIQNYSDVRYQSSSKGKTLFPEESREFNARVQPHHVRAANQHETLYIYAIPLQLYSNKEL